MDPDVYALAVLDSLAEGDDEAAEALLAEAGWEDVPSDADTPDPGAPSPAPTTSLKALSLPPRVLAAVELHGRVSAEERERLVRLAAEDPEQYERLIDDAVAEMGE